MGGLHWVLRARVPATVGAPACHAFACVGARWPGAFSPSESTKMHETKTEKNERARAPCPRASLDLLLRAAPRKVLPLPPLSC